MNVTQIQAPAGRHVATRASLLNRITARRPSPTGPVAAADPHEDTLSVLVGVHAVAKQAVMARAQLLRQEAFTAPGQLGTPEQQQQTLGGYLKGYLSQAGTWRDDVVAATILGLADGLTQMGRL
jgi:hypothetical protein